MLYSPTTLVHIAGGIAALGAGAVAMVARKGSRVHKRSGDVYTIAMMIMAATGALVAFVKSEPGNVLAGAGTFYLVSTAALSAMRRTPLTRWLELALMALAIASGGAAWICGIVATRGAAMFYILGSLLLLWSFNDFRMLLRRSATAAQRTLRHVWRMCFSMFIATGSFFLGKADDPVLKRAGLRAQLFDGIRATHIPSIPVWLVVIFTVFWLCRARCAEEGEMEPTDYTARLAGALYTLAALFAPFGLFAPGSLIVRNNAAATAASIRASELLFRSGIAAQLVSAAIAVIVAIVLYRVFRRRSRAQAVAMVGLSIAGVPISFFAVANELAALALIRPPDFLSIIDGSQLDAMAMFFLRVSAHTIAVGEIFWFLWFIAVGVLAMRARLASGRFEPERSLAAAAA